MVNVLVIGGAVALILVGGLVWLLTIFTKKVTAIIRGIEVTGGREICFDDIVHEKYNSDEKCMKWKIRGLKRITDPCPTKYVHTNFKGQKVVYLVKDNDDLKWVDIGDYHKIIEALKTGKDSAYLDHIPVSNASRQAIVHQIRIANTRKQSTFLDMLSAAAPYIMLVIVIIGAAMTWKTVGGEMKTISGDMKEITQMQVEYQKTNAALFEIMTDFIDEKQRLALDARLNLTRGAPS